MGRPMRRLLLTILGLCVPGLVVLVGLVAGGLLRGSPALAAAIALIALSCVIFGPLAAALHRTQAVLARLAIDPASQATIAVSGIARLSPTGAALLASLARLARVGRERLAAAENRQAAAEAVIAAVPDALILIDGRRRIVRTNAPAAELIGTHAEPRDLAAGLRNPAVLAAADAVLAGAPECSVEFAVAVPTERRLRAHIAGIAGPALDGAVAVLTLHDITALKRAEQMRADFIANAGHELKTPLAALLGFIETLRGPARTDARARERFLKIMHEQALRMTRLVDDLLSLSRIELNEHVIPSGRVALPPLLQHIADTLELRAAERGVQIVLALPPDLPEVTGHRDELAQLFQNLIDNAIKYGRAGTEVRVEGGLETAAPTALVRVAVSDQGEGIAGVHLPRLTERFYRVDTPRSHASGGTGLGLAIVKHILNRHRGTLAIDSTLGVGSVFTVRLRPAPSVTEL
ncbi:MAG: hypothetical protein JO267_07370 [Alphaproteobacteria bacterium]|nr:hypothetical protein [Alphaproteobacteria bacterium]MBV9861951.1 hypothetical protein [Alphaproteobacteria bacterium]